MTGERATEAAGCGASRCTTRSIRPLSLLQRGGNRYGDPNSERIRRMTCLVHAKCLANTRVGLSKPFEERPVCPTVNFLGALSPLVPHHDQQLVTVSRRKVCPRGAVWKQAQPRLCTQAEDVNLRGFGSQSLCWVIPERRRHLAGLLRVLSNIECRGRTTTPQSHVLIPVRPEVPSPRQARPPRRTRTPPRVRPAARAHRLSSRRPAWRCRSRCREVR